MRPWLCSNDHPREAGGTSVTHIGNAHRTTIARPTKLPTFLLYSTVPVAQSAAVSLNLGFKYGLGLAHIPTGSLAANQAYFMIAALAWNLKTWMLNLLHLGDGAVMRFQRFRYLWIWQAGVVAMSGRNTVVLKLPAGEYFQRFGVAMARLATL